MTGSFSDMTAADMSSNGHGLRSVEVPKSATAFRTISEVATDLEVPQHVLRFWESKFQQIRPLKRGGGRRYYRPEDIQLISSIKDLLYNQGFTIRGVQKLLKENSRFPSARSMVPDPQLPMSMTGTLAASPSAAVTMAARTAPQQQSLSPELRRELHTVLTELKALRELLKQSGI
jgi:DNA-binding transcriptional MerR regulator